MDDHSELDTLDAVIAYFVATADAYADLYLSDEDVSA